jgi:hypothetical protein
MRRFGNAAHQTRTLADYELVDWPPFSFSVCRLLEVRAICARAIRGEGSSPFSFFFPLTTRLDFALSPLSPLLFYWAGVSCAVFWRFDPLQLFGHSVERNLARGCVYWLVCSDGRLGRGGEVAGGPHHQPGGGAVGRLIHTHRMRARYDPRPIS